MYNINSFNNMKFRKGAHDKLTVIAYKQKLSQTQKKKRRKEYERKKIKCSQ